MPFNPGACQWDSWPFVAKPNCGAFSSGSHVGYLQGVLKCKVGDTDWNPPNPPIAPPYWFDGATFNGVKAVQAWFGRPITGYMDQATWNIIDYLAVWT